MASAELNSAALLNSFTSPVLRPIRKPMNLPAILDVIIGLVFIYLILSLLASEIQELIATLLQWRAKHLKESIEILLAGGTNPDDPRVGLSRSCRSYKPIDQARKLANQLYNDPLLQNMNQEAKGLVENELRRVTWIFSSLYERIYTFITGKEPIFGSKRSAPSYIPSETFATVILENLGFDKLSKALVETRLEVFCQVVLQEVSTIVQSTEGVATFAGTEERLQKLENSFNTILGDFQHSKLSLMTSLDRMVEAINHFLRSFPRQAKDDSTWRDTYQELGDRLQAMQQGLFGDGNERAIVAGGLKPGIAELVALLRSDSTLHQDLRSKLNQKNLNQRQEVERAVEQFQTDILWCVQQIQETDPIVKSQVQEYQFVRLYREFYDTNQRFKQDKISLVWVDNEMFSSLKRLIEFYTTEKTSPDFGDRLNAFCQGVFYEQQQTAHPHPASDPTLRELERVTQLLKTNIQHTIKQQPASDPNAIAESREINYCFKQFCIDLDGIVTRYRNGKTALPLSIFRILECLETLHKSALPNAEIAALIQDYKEQIRRQVALFRVLHPSENGLTEGQEPITLIQANFQPRSPLEQQLNSLIQHAFLNSKELTDIGQDIYRRFRLAIEGKLTPLEVSENCLEQMPPAVQSSIAALARRAQTRRKQVENEVQQLREEIQLWFDRSMDRSSGVYKRNAKLVAIALGILLSMGTNSDSLHILRRLSTDENLRQVITSQAGQLQSSSQSPTANSAAPGSSPQTTTPDADLSDQLSTLKEETDTILQQVSLPIGWSPDMMRQQLELPPNSPSEIEQAARAANIPNIEQAWISLFHQHGNYAQPPRQFFYPAAILRLMANYPLAGLQMLLGWAISGLAIAMGAPFWFDLLSRIVNVRNTGNRPRSTAAEETE